MTSNKNPSKKHPQNFPIEIPRNSFENHQKGKTGRISNKPWGTTPNHLYIPWKVHTRSSSRRIILSSHKILPWSSQASPMYILRKIGRANRKTKWARVPRDGYHLLSHWVIWRQAERLKYP
jgi:hypothetical protein